jgi:hypothetical protein
VKRVPKRARSKISRGTVCQMKGRKQPRVFEGEQGEQGVCENEEPLSRRSGESTNLFEKRDKETGLPQEVAQQLYSLRRARIVMRGGKITRHGFQQSLSTFVCHLSEVPKETNFPPPPPGAQETKCSQRLGLNWK